MINQEKSMYSESRDSWVESLSKIFKSPIPVKSVWKGPKNIASVLNAFRDNQFTYLFFPDGGGVHLGMAKPAGENGCIELYSHDIDNDYSRIEPYIISVNTLHFHQPGEDLSWSYFILDANPLIPVTRKADSNYSGGYEEASDHGGGNYSTVQSEVGEDGIFHGKKVSRRLAGGLYMLVNNISPYNHLENDIDPKHQKLGIDGITVYMEKLYTAYLNKFGSSNFEAMILRES